MISDSSFQVLLLTFLRHNDTNGEPLKKYGKKISEGAANLHFN